jgi:hypothetical protein
VLLTSSTDVCFPIVRKNTKTLACRRAPLKLSLARTNDFENGTESSCVQVIVYLNLGFLHPVAPVLDKINNLYYIILYYIILYYIYYIILYCIILYLYVFILRLILSLTIYDLTF